MKTIRMSDEQMNKRIARFRRLSPLPIQQSDIPLAARDVVYSRKLLSVIGLETSTPINAAAPIIGAAGMTMTLAVCPPGQGPGLHSHRKTYETFTVLKGRFEVRWNDDGSGSAVLELYDKRFRNLASPLVRAMPDLYIDVQNAASMLFRLERQGVDIGTRWNELGEKAQARIGDCQSAFTLPHWMMALAATGREGAAHLMLSSLRENANRVVREVGFPVCEAVLAHRRGDYGRAVLCMAPVLERLHELGGSHAQRDVLHQLYFDACLKSQRSAEARAASETLFGRAIREWLGDGWRGSPRAREPGCRSRSLPAPARDRDRR